MLNVAMLGASGRMGRTIVPLLAESADLRLSRGACRPGGRGDRPGRGRARRHRAACGRHLRGPGGRAGRRAGGHRLHAARGLGRERPALSRAQGCAMVVGTTGHDAGQRAELQAIAGEIPVVLAPNMSLGVNLLFKLAELASRALDEQYDIEVFEAHHRNKVDAPSGTALGLGAAAARGRGTTLEQAADYARHGHTGVRGARPDRFQRAARGRHRGRAPAGLRRPRRAGRARARRPGPLRVRPGRAGGRALDRRAAARPLFHAGRARALRPSGSHGAPAASRVNFRP